MSLFNTILRTHQNIYESTDGRLGHKMLGVPTLLLRTKGRKSGAERTSALIYVDDNGSKVIVASNGGDAKHPSWLHNLKSDPEVEYQIKRKRFRATAEVIEKDHPDYDRLWREHNERNADRYDQYQSMTRRPIPLVRLVTRP